MHIRNILLNNFGYDEETEEPVYREFLIQLPQTGLVLVTGDNGSGKSLALVESIGQAVWGKPVRKGGAMGWHPKETTIVGIDTDKLCVRRSRKGSKTTLRFWPAGGENMNDYDSATKAQEALLEQVGSFEIWSHSSVFSSSSMNHFTQASAGERQHYLETLFGLRRFDNASESCRTDLTESETNLRKVSARLASLEQRLAAQHQRIKDAESALTDTEEVEQVDVEEISAMSVLINTLEKSMSKLMRQIRDVHGRNVGLRTELAGLQRQLDNLSQSRCPTCGQKISEEFRGQVETEHRELKKSLDAQQEAVKGDIAKFEEVLEKMRTEKVEKVEHKTELQSKHRFAQAMAKTVNAQQVILDEAVRVVGEMETEREEIEEQLATEELSLRTLRAVDTVLGLKGVRSHILAEALHGIESIGNAWLDRFCTSRKYQMSLTPARETKKGGVVNGINLSIRGAGGGHGYGTCSDGQRRRIDLALLFANAEIAASASGREPGTLLIDEACDGLDADGVNAFAEVIRELATDRAVVVISHRPDLALALHPDRHLVASNGQVTAI
jgi:DNA repair exonuclease SbcCD ATPase subunit